MHPIEEVKIHTDVFGGSVKYAVEDDPPVEDDGVQESRMGQRVSKLMGTKR